MTDTSPPSSPPTSPRGARIVSAPQGRLASLMTFLLLRSDQDVSLALLGPNRAVFEWRGHVYDVVDHTHSTRMETLAVIASGLENASKASLTVGVLGGDVELAGAVEHLASQHGSRTPVVHLSSSGNVSVLGKPARKDPLPTWLRESARTEPASPDTLMPIALLAARKYERSLAQQNAFAQRFREKRPVATIALVVALLAVFALELLWGSPEATPTLVRMGALVPELVDAGEWWRLASCASLHASVLHALVNCYALFGLGVAVEKILGSWRFLIVYCASALAGGIASYTLTRGTSVGASGAIWGLMLATLTLALNRQRLLPPYTARSLRTALMRFFLLNVGISFLPGIDLWAHFGGGAAGALAIYSGVATSGVPTFTQAAHVTPRAGPVVRAIGALGVALLASGISIAIYVGQPWRLAAGAQTAVRVDVGAPLSFEVPDLLSEDRSEKVLGDGRAEIAFGDLNRDGAVVALRLRSFPSQPESDDVARSLLSSRAGVHRKLGDDLVVVREPTLEKVGGHWALVSDFRSASDQLRFSAATVLAGSHEYEFQFAYLAESGGAYESLREGVLGSLAP